MAKTVLAFTLFFIGLQSVYGFGTGAPASACDSMIPGHHNLTVEDPKPLLSPQDMELSPYTIMLNDSTYTGNSAVSVTITGAEFRGILIQARAEGSTVPVGTFVDLDEKMQTRSCAGNDLGAVTHTNALNNVFSSPTKLTWVAPSNTVGNLTFYVTISKTHDVFWVKLESNMLESAGFKLTFNLWLMAMAVMVTFLRH